jgi:DNA-binding NtrC family response regulator
MPMQLPSPSVIIKVNSNDPVAAEKSVEKRSKAWSNEEEVTSHGLIEKNHSVNAVSEMMGIHRNRVTNKCAELGVSVRWETVADVIKKNYRKG